MTLSLAQANPHPLNYPSLNKRPSSMPHRYFYPQEISKDTPISLSREELGHLTKVMRTKPGDLFEVVNGRGQLASCKFDEEISVENVETRQKPSKTPKLALALTEPKHLELVIEKATELGIMEFFIFPSKKSKLTKLSDSKKERITKILISALKQSKRLFLPIVHYLSSKEALPEDETYLLADFKGDTFKPVTETSTFIIGPESGFTPDEIEFFKSKRNATPVLIADAVLRTETAALCAATLLSL